MNKEIIFPESDRAATFRKIEGWVSCDGRFYGKDEQTARWGGATHVHCSKCGNPCPKAWTACEACRVKQAHERYNKFPLVIWDENVPVYSVVTDKYYWSRDEVRDEDMEGIFDPVSLQLVLCSPIYAGEIDPESYYEDLLPEYDELSDISQDLVNMFQEFNDHLQELHIVLSYEPCNIAVI